MRATQLRKTLQAYAVWTPVAFSAFLSLMVVCVHISSVLRLKTPPTASDVWVPVFFAFLPMTFFFASASQKQTRENIKVLEARIQRLEADKAAAS